jgi:phage baseplate assembly protein gpV
MSTIVTTIQEIVRQEMRRVRVAEMGLVEAVLPHNSGSDKENYACDVKLKNSGLLLKGVPVMTNHIGTAAIPNVGDLVLLTFDKGDINQPIIIGRLYNEQDRPPLSTTDEVIFRLPLAEADDKTIKAAFRNHQSSSASSGSATPRELIFEMPPKITVRVNDGTVHATAGKTEMKLDQSNGNTGGTVTVLAGNTKIVMNQDGDITVEAAGAMTLKATRDLKIEGQNVSIKGQVNTSIEAGSQATLKGNLSATVQGGASATVQAASLSLKGITSFSP